MRAIQTHVKDLGGFSVRRALPTIDKKSVGPFVFFDHFGPATFPIGEGLDVRPHPHIGLSTVTYLFEGEIQHRDSLGFDQGIRPGDLNLMLAGKGIVHSERTPEPRRHQPHPLHGLQTWLALPIAEEDCAPSFTHFAQKKIPAWKEGETTCHLLMGKIAEYASPVYTPSPTFYLVAEASGDSTFQIMPDWGEELALYIIEGKLLAGEQDLQPHHLYLMGDLQEPLQLRLSAGAHFVVFGGEKLPEKRYVWWNFVASSPEKIEAAKNLWQEQRFGSVEGDPTFIPLPT